MCVCVSAQRVARWDHTHVYTNRRTHAHDGESAHARALSLSHSVWKTGILAHTSSRVHAHTHTRALSLSLARSLALSPLRTCAPTQKHTLSYSLTLGVLKSLVCTRSATEFLGRVISTAAKTSGKSAPSCNYNRKEPCRVLSR